MVNLFLNDQDLGVYTVEESFSKELIERQNRRNGPIFGLSEELGEYFPNVRYELYSENFWINNFPKLTSDLFSTLNNIKLGNFHINDHFDIDKWAKYFAIMDLTGAYHGSLIKSVKLYYNPTTALFDGALLTDGFSKTLAIKKLLFDKCCLTLNIPHLETFFLFTLMLAITEELYFL